MLHHEFKQKKEELKDTTKTSILAKYGGAEYLDVAPKELRQGQTENYVEYSRTGQVIKGKERAKVRSKYPEDGTHSTLFLARPFLMSPLLVYINNHTAVWGSYYDKATSEWGYACCHSTLHISYCAGLAGIEATEASSARQLLGANSQEESSSSTVKETSSTKQKERIEQNFSKTRVGENENVVLDKEKLDRALKEEKKRKAKNDYDDEDRFSKKSKSGTGDSSTHDVTEEQLGTLEPACLFVRD